MTRTEHPEHLPSSTAPTAESLRPITLAECFRALRETGQSRSLEQAPPPLPQHLPVEQTLETQLPPELLEELQRLAQQEDEGSATPRLFDVVAQVMTPPPSTHEGSSHASTEPAVLTFQAALPPPTLPLKLLALGIALLGILLAVMLFLGHA